MRNGVCTWMWVYTMMATCYGCQSFRNSEVLQQNLIIYKSWLCKLNVVMNYMLICAWHSNRWSEINYFCPCNISITLKYYFTACLHLSSPFMVIANRVCFNSERERTMKSFLSKCKWKIFMRFGRVHLTTELSNVLVMFTFMLVIYINISDTL